MNGNLLRAAPIVTSESAAAPRLSLIIVRTLAQVSFTLTLILIPFRVRTILQSRPAPPLYSDYTDFLLFAADITMLVTILLWGAARLVERKKITPGPWVVSLPLAGVTLMGWVSILFSHDAGLSLYHAVRLTLLALFYLYIVNEVHSPRIFTFPVAVQVAVQATAGIMQILEQHSLGLKLLGELELDPATPGVSVYTLEGVRWLRAYGLSDHPNILGGCLALGLLVLLYAASRRDGWKGILAGGIFILGAEALFLTFSRSAWLAFSCGAAIWVAYQALKNRRSGLLRTLTWCLSAGVVTLPLLLHFSPAVSTRLHLSTQADENPQEVQSLGERQLLNRSANQLFVENALTGVGLGASPVALRERFPVFRVDYQPAHLVLLDAAAETGILGATFYALILILPWAAMWANRRQLQFSAGLALSSSLLLACSVVGFLDYYTWLLVPGRLLQWSVWGLWAGMYARARASRPHP